MDPFVLYSLFSVLIMCLNLQFDVVIQVISHFIVLELNISSDIDLLEPLYQFPNTYQKYVWKILRYFDFCHTTHNTVRTNLLNLYCSYFYLFFL